MALYDGLFAGIQWDLRRFANDYMTHGSNMFILDWIAATVRPKSSAPAPSAVAAPLSSFTAPSSAMSSGMATQLSGRVVTAEDIAVEIPKWISLDSMSTRNILDMDQSLRAYFPDVTAEMAARGLLQLMPMLCPC